MTRATPCLIKYQHSASREAKTRGHQQLTASPVDPSPGFGNPTEQPHLARRNNWTNQLARHALMQPDDVALRFLGRTTTWGDLDRRVHALAGALSRRGVGFGILRWLSGDAELRGRLAAVPAAEVVFNYLGQFGGGGDEGAWLRGARESAGADHSPRARRTAAVQVAASAHAYPLP